MILLLTLQVTLIFHLFKDGVHALYKLLDLVSLGKVHVYSFRVRFTIELLLHVHRIGFSVNDLECLVLALADFLLDDLLKLVKLLDNVLLAVAQRILYFVQLHLVFELSNEVCLSLKQFHGGYFLSDIPSHHFDFFQHSLCLLVLLPFRSSYELIDKLSCLLNVSFPFILELLHLFLEEDHFLVCPLSLFHCFARLVFCLC